jgi:hypothetical protein
MYCNEAPQRIVTKSLYRTALPFLYSMVVPVSIGALREDALVFPRVLIEDDILVALPPRFLIHIIHLQELSSMFMEMSFLALEKTSKFEHKKNIVL